MTKETAFFIFFCFIASVFLVLWLAGRKFIREAANTEQNVDVLKGKILDISGWGSASVNGVRVTKGIRIVRYENGFLLEFKMLFGGSELWLPKESVKILGSNNGMAKEIESNENKIILYGKLARKIV